MKKIFVAVLSLFPYLYTYAQTSMPDSGKRGYTIFNPTPKAKMRGMQTDRPDVTESAFSVDAGHFQMEGDAYRLTSNNNSSIKTRQSYYNLANMKIGLSNSVDLQLVVPFYLQEKSQTANGQVHKISGFNEFTFRLKKNVWGNDKGRTALAIMPFVNFQTGNNVADRRAEGGFVIPFSLELSDIWSLGTQAQFSLLRNEQRKYDKELLYSMTVGKALSLKSSAFVESHYTYNFNLHNFQMFVNGGFVYSVSENFNLDFGVNYGLSRASDRSYFIGYSFRL
jgi:hypothetical protein